MAGKGIERRYLAWTIVVVLLVASFPGSLFADFAQNRDFLISVNGKEAGFSRMSIAQKGDGAFTVSVQASVELKIFFTYRFMLDSTEYWKDGRLVQMKTSVNDNGKQEQVTAAAQNDQIVVRKSDGVDRSAQPDAWVTSFWRLADAKYHNKNVPILESYTAETYTGLLQYVGTEPLRVGDQNVNCYHFRVTGGAYPVDLWYDQYYLLVREEFTKSGQRMAIQLLNIR